MPFTSTEREKLYTLRFISRKQWGDNCEAVRLLTDLLGDGSSEPSSAAQPEIKPVSVSWLVPASQPFPIVGRAFLAGGLASWLASIKDSEMQWRPKGITIHHCAEPSLAQRPNGFLEQHMRNLRSFYHGQLGWSSGPHFFIDEDQAWAFTPVSRRGVHAKSFNATHIGIEMLGNYDTEDPNSGRGAEVLRMTAATAKALMRRFGLSASSINFHRDDPKTDKSCPGKRITKAAFLELVQNAP